MSLFNVDMRLWITQQLNPEQRTKAPIINLIQAWLEPVADLFASTDIDTEKNLIRARASGQPIKIRKALQLLTGITGITVTLNTNVINNFLFLPSESPVYIGLPGESSLNFTLFTPLETTDDFSFTIGVPSSELNLDVEALISAELLFFGTATQNFNIVAI